ncbi:MAG: F0F1 ATP synthase subunit B [Bacteroidales bacterium]|jgi:F-type H+-transporting ATPase subunit b|nr:F0F1 ATP synthase subunit B [Bacteroidales bacterium]
MELINPDVGLIIWMTVSFLILLFLLGKFAWKPVLKMLNEREEKINMALNEANLAKEEMKQLAVNNERLLMAAKDERDAILNEARKVSQKMYDDAKRKAQEESQRILVSAKEDINIEKQKAITDIRNMIAEISLEIAEKVIEQELSDKQKHQQYISKRIETLNFN